VDQEVPHDGDKSRLLSFAPFDQSFALSVGNWDSVAKKDYPIQVGDFVKDEVEIP